MHVLARDIRNKCAGFEHGPAFTLLQFLLLLQKRTFTHRWLEYSFNHNVGRRLSSEDLVKIV